MRTDFHVGSYLCRFRFCVPGLADSDFHYQRLSSYFSGLGIGNKSCGQAVVLCSSKVQPPGHHAAWKVLENMYM